MVEKTKVLIAGLGAIGGYFGCKLCASNPNDGSLSIEFLVREKSVSFVQEQGLMVRDGGLEITGKPDDVFHDARGKGTYDYILICTKTPDLLGILDCISQSVGERTVIIPLMNGVQSVLQIKDRFPSALVCYGCTNIVVRKVGDGAVEKFSEFEKLHFGIPSQTDDRLTYFYQLLRSAGIDAALTEEIEPVIWTKFLFISSAAASTCYFNATFGQIRSNRDFFDTFLALLDEGIDLALKMNVRLNLGTKENIIGMLMATPIDATTSLHSDLQDNNPRNEMEELIGFFEAKSKEMGIGMPYHQMVYESLKKK